MAKASKAGSILLLIAAIISFFLAVIIAFVGLVILFLGLSNQTGIPNWVVGLIVLVVAIIISVIGFLKLWASNLMKNPSTTRKGGIIALVLGVLTGPDLLALIGGILGIVEGAD